MLATPSHAVDVHVALAVVGPAKSGAAVAVIYSEQHDAIEGLDVGSGFPAPPPTPPLPVRFGRVAVVGVLDRAIVRRELAHQLDALAICAGTPGLVVAELTIAAGTGAASSVTAGSVDAKLAACVTSALGHAQFPTPQRDVALVAPIAFDR